VVPRARKACKACRALCAGAFCKECPGVLLCLPPKQRAEEATPPLPPPIRALQCSDTHTHSDTACTVAMLHAVSMVLFDGITQFWHSTCCSVGV
jgi:hypothetical protein